MAQPTPYTRQSNLTAYAVANPAAPYPPSSVDAEFNAIMVSVDETIANIGLIQRDDGQLQNAIVTPDSLNTATLNLMGSWAPTGPWLPGQAYAVRDMVTILSTATSYVCATAHVSGTFANDLAAGYWQAVNQGNSDPASSITFSATDRVLGRSSPGAGAGEEIVCTAAARSIMDDTTTAAICTTLGLGTGSNPTFNNLTVSGATILGLQPISFIYSNASRQIANTVSPTNGQLLIGNTGAAPIIGTITGFAGQITVTNGPGTITLTLPQDIGLTDSPTYAGLNLTGLSQGSVVFVGASSALSQDASSFVWDNTNNRLGIGTASPAYRIDIVGAPGDATMRLRYLTGTAAGVVFEAGGFGMTGGFSAGDEVNTAAFFGSDDTAFVLPSTSAIAWATTATGLGTDDLRLYRDAASTLAQRSGATAQVSRVYRTFTDAANYERVALQSGAGYFEVAAETAGTGTNDIALRLTPAGTGDVVLPASTIFSWLARAEMSSPADGIVLLTDAAGTDFTRLQFGGTTSSFPAIKRSTTALHMRLADDSAFTSLLVGGVNVCAGTATPAAGSTAARLLFGTTAAFGIYYGSGAPTVVAAKGSLYLRSDGTGVNDRMYVATDGAGTWTAVVTVA